MWPMPVDWRGPKLNNLTKGDKYKWKLGRVDKRDSHSAIGVVQAGICDGDQLGTRRLLILVLAAHSQPITITELAIHDRCLNLCCQELFGIVQIQNVPIQDHNICQFADFQRAKLVFHS